MFRRLSGAQDGKRDVRAPARVGEVARIAAVDPDEVIAVVEAFRRADRCFLATPERLLDQNTLLDLSHESLIRQWNRVAGWAAQEAKSAEMYQRVRDWALRWERGDAELWRGPDLANAVSWRRHEAPNDAWAERYGDREQFRLAMTFLEASEAAQRAAAAAEEAKRQQQLRRVRHLAWGFGGAFATLVATILLYSIAYRWDHVTYWKDYTEVWGVGQGIGRLSRADSAHRSASYRFITRGVFGSVLSMEQVNSAGHLGYGLSGMVALAGGKSDEEFRSEFVYDSNERIAYEVALDKHGQRIRTTIYAPWAPGSERSRRAYVIGPKGSLAPEKGSCAAFVHYDYSPEGYVTQIHYYDQNGNPTPGKDGAFIKQKKYDWLGRAIESTSLWKDGRPMNDITHVAGEHRSYDDQGNLISLKSVDAAGNPTELKSKVVENVYRTTMKYDNRGNFSQIYLQRANGDSYPIFGCKILRSSVDPRGRPVEGYCIRTNGQLSKTGWAVTRNKFDEDDQLIESAYFDSEGHPVLGPDGAFQDKVKYDRDGHVTESAAYGTDRRPIFNNLGYHKKITKFDKNGHETRTEYRDPEGRLVVLDEGFAAVNKEYDAQGNETVTTYLGVDDRPVSNRTEGYAIKTASYDGCGRATEIKFFDANNHPVRSKKGYAGIRQNYDENNNVGEEAYFDEKNRPGHSADGYARVVREFDRNRNIIDEGYSDTQGKPFLVKGRYAEHKSRYDDHNSLVEEAYLGSNGEPVANEKGWARHRLRYDKHNAMVEEAWLGPAGEPVANDEGWARMININDAHGRDLETAWFGIDGKPIILQNGYARRTRHYDDGGRVIEEAYFGTEGQPVVSKDGYARIATVYDALGHIIESTHFGVHGEKVIGTTEDYHRAKVAPDERGNRLEFAAFGPDDKPMQKRDGYFRNVMRYDVHDHLVEDSYFGVDGAPVVSGAGYSRATQAFDARGKVIEVAFFGTDGKPMVKNGYAKFTRRYNDYGDLKEEAAFGTGGEPVLGPEGYARLTRVNDRGGRVIEEAYFGIDGKPVTQKNGYAKVTHRYDPQGGVLEDAYFGPAGEPVLNEQGYSRKVYIKDDRERDIIETAYFGTDGQPILNSRGFARAKSVTDDLGRPIESSYFGVRGEPIMGKNGYHFHRIAMKLDARGNQIEVATFGLDGKPIEVDDLANLASGRRCARLVRRFDTNNKVTQSQCFDASGMPVDLRRP
jgi:hypothetical protein